jgi:hypothetical protein
MSENIDAKQKDAFPYGYSSLFVKSLEAVLKVSHISNATLAYAGKKVSEYCRHSYGHAHEDTRDYFGVLDYFTHDALVRIAIPWQIPGKGMRPSPGLERPVRVTSNVPVPDATVRSLCNALTLELAAYLPPRHAPSIDHKLYK